MAKHYIAKREGGSGVDVTTGEHLFDASKRFHRAARKGLHRYSAIGEAQQDDPAVEAFLNALRAATADAPAADPFFWPADGLANEPRE